MSHTAQHIIEPENLTRPSHQTMATSSKSNIFINTIPFPPTSSSSMAPSPSTISVLSSSTPNLTLLDDNTTMLLTQQPFSSQSQSSQNLETTANNNHTGAGGVQSTMGKTAANSNSGIKSQAKGPYCIMTPCSNSHHFEERRFLTFIVNKISRLKKTLQTFL